MSVFREAGRFSIIRVQIIIVSGDDASEGVQRQRESFVHVLAQPCVVLLAQIVFGPHRLLDAVSRIQARGHLDATTQTVGVAKDSDWHSFMSLVGFSAVLIRWNYFLLIYRVF